MIDDLTKEQRRVLLYWIIFGLILMGVLITVASIKISEKKKYQQTVDKNYSIVNDYSRYYTIINIMDKYYNLINKKDYNELSKLLSDNYKKNNDINADNIKDKLDFYDKSVTYKGRIMCSKRLGKGYTSYYVAGNVIGMNDLSEYDTKYYEVVLNENEMTFSISILDASTYGGACHA